MFKQGAFAIIFDENKKILLHHRTDMDLWSLPGGKVDPSESPWEAVLREVKEETGFEAKILRLVGLYSKPENEEVIFCFECEIIGGEKTLNEEADQIEFFEYKNIPKHFSPRQLERVKDALENKEVVLKTQTGPSSKELLKQGKLD